MNRHKSLAATVLAMLGVLLLTGALVSTLHTGYASRDSADGATMVAFDMVNTTSQNLLSFTNNAPPFSSGGDGFDKFQRNVSPSIPFDLMDDSLTIFPGDTQGIITEANLDEFFGVNDTENGDNSGPVTAVWAFDIARTTDLSLAIDMGAMGDFEAAATSPADYDFFAWTYQIDGGAVMTAFVGVVDDTDTFTYTLSDGDMFNLNDPIKVNDTTLSNVLAPFASPLVGAGDILTITLTARTTSGAESLAFQNLVIYGQVAPSTIAYDMVNSTNLNLNSFTNSAPPFSSGGDGFGKYQRGVSPSIPFDMLDDSLTIFPGDTHGIITEANTEQFFGANDTENGDNTGPVSATWEFDINNATDLGLSINMGAMGDFETADTNPADYDFFAWTYQIDGGAVMTAFVGVVDDTDTVTYTLSDGDMFALNDPMTVNETVLTNNLATFETDLGGSGSTLVLTLTARTSSGSETYAFQDIIVSGVASSVDVPPTVANTVPADGAAGILPDATITINFSEPVTAAAGWYAITCGGVVQSATPSGGPQSYVLTPNADLPGAESCTVEIDNTRITDQDGTPDLMAEPYAFSFDVSFSPTDCTQPATLIHAIQGSGNDSPEDGVQHIIQGVVVGDFQDSNVLGFFVQEEDADADGDSATSDGIFVYAPSGIDVSEGDLVRVSGVVDEYFGLTELTNVTTIVECAMGVPLPTAGALTLPVPADVDGVPYLERFEGMAVAVADPLVVTEVFGLGRGGQLTLSGIDRLMQPTQIALPGADAQAQQAANDLNKIILDDGSLLQNPDPIFYPEPDGLSAANTVRGGDTVDDIVGVLTYSWSGWSGTDAYRIHPTGEPTFTAANARPTQPEDLGGDLTVASFNVLNYFVTIDDGPAICGPLGNMDCRGADSETEFTRQRDKIINAILAIDADIVGLIEIENHVSDAAVADLVQGLNDAAGETLYAYVATGPIGGDAIKVAIIYQPDSVAPVGAHAVLDSSFDADYIDDKNRPALAQTFADGNDERFTVVVNHLKSKGSDCEDVGDPDLGDGQGNCNLTRLKAAEVEAAWLATDPTNSGDPDFLILGDLNSYAMEDPIMALEDAGYLDLAALFGETYSYVFDGQWGTLDYALANTSLLQQVDGAAAYHINADEPIVLDYNEEFKSAEQLTTLYSDAQYRASDHDAIVVGLSLETPELTIEKRVTFANETVRPGDTVTYTIAVENTSEVDAVGVRVIDTLPAGVTGTDLDVTVTIGTGETETFTIVATVNAGTAGSTIVNTASYTFMEMGESDSAEFTVASPIYTIFLPFVTRSP